MTAVTDPFADLADDFDVIPKTSNSVVKWEGEVPDSAINWVARALKTGNRISIPCGNVELRNRLHSAVKAALELETLDLAIHTRDKLDEDGNLEAFTFTVGAPRGRKPRESAE